MRCSTRTVWIGWGGPQPNAPKMTNGWTCEWPMLRIPAIDPPCDITDEMKTCLPCNWYQGLAIDHRRNVTLARLRLRLAKVIKPTYRLHNWRTGKCCVTDLLTVLPVTAFRCLTLHSGFIPCRSAASGMLVVPACSTKIIGPRVFAVFGSSFLEQSSHGIALQKNLENTFLSTPMLARLK